MNTQIWKDSNLQKPTPLSFIVAVDKKTKDSYVGYNSYLEGRYELQEYFWIEIPTLPFTND